MADLRLKVSEEKYRDTITKLEGKISKLEGLLGSIQEQRQKLEREYTGPQATDAINTVKKNEKNVEDAIEKVRTQKQKLVNYLDLMSRTDTEIKNNYKDALDAAKNVFG